MTGSGSAASAKRPRYRQQRRQSSSKIGLWIGGGVAATILVIVGLVIGSGSGGGGNFEMTAYQGADRLGGSTVDFDEVKLAANGKPIVLNFWGGSCPPCRAEMPGFQQAYERNSNDFMMVGLDVGPFFGLGTQNSALQLLRDLEISYPAAYATSRAPISQFRATALPSTFFFDGDGNLVSSVVGFMYETEFERRLQDLIGVPAADALHGEDGNA